MSGGLFSAFTVFVIAFFTLAVYSFLYRDNPIYKFAEHLFVGVASGYYVITQYRNIFRDSVWRPLFEDPAKGGFAALGDPVAKTDMWTFLLLIPLAFGMLMFFKFNPKTSWLARWPMAVVIGSFSGLAVIGFAQGDLIPQIQANLISFIKPGSIDSLAAATTGTEYFFAILDVLWNPILLIGVSSALVYFFFSKAHTGVTGGIATVGIWFLMASFGASYGNTVMTRISLLLERLDFLVGNMPVAPGSAIRNWHISLVTLAILVAVLFAYFRMHPEERSTVGG